ncbi:hypothetical protein QE152_g27422 [Popillia japonica]|uniref:Uncharacterized protein n=1 Tax=Popillia japonica TaxID=7064 RepID=A0AAW1JSF2_POPJA
MVRKILLFLDGPHSIPALTHKAAYSPTLAPFANFNKIIVLRGRESVRESGCRWYGWGTIASVSARLWHDGALSLPLMRWNEKLTDETEKRKSVKRPGRPLT